MLDLLLLTPYLQIIMPSSSSAIDGESLLGSQLSDSCATIWKMSWSWINLMCILMCQGKQKQLLTLNVNSHWFLPLVLIQHMQFGLDWLENKTKKF